MMGILGRIKEWFTGKGGGKEKRQDIKESPETEYRPTEVMKVSDDIVARDIEKGFGSGKQAKKKPKVGKAKKKPGKKAKKSASGKKKAGKPRKKSRKAGKRK